MTAGSFAFSLPETRCRLGSACKPAVCLDLFRFPGMIVFETDSHDRKRDPYAPYALWLFGPTVSGRTVFRPKLGETENFTKSSKQGGLNGIRFFLGKCCKEDGLGDVSAGNTKLDGAPQASRVDGVVGCRAD